MKLQFDSSQDYQLAAIRAIVDIFEGQPLNKSDFEVSLAMERSSLAFTEKGIANNLLLSDEQILQNVRAAQERNGLRLSERLERCEYIADAATGATAAIPLNFTIEMETGTGKTYVYLQIGRAHV